MDNIQLTNDEREALASLLDGVIDCGPYDDTAEAGEYLVLLQRVRRKLGVTGAG